MGGRQSYSSSSSVINIKLYKNVSLKELKEQFTKIAERRTFSTLAPILQTFPIHVVDMSNVEKITILDCYFTLTLYEWIYPSSQQVVERIEYLEKNPKVKVGLGLDKPQYDMFFVNVI